MNTELLAKVIMMPDAYVYIAFKDNSIVTCTISRLSILLASPIECYQKHRQWQNIKNLIVDNNNDFYDFPGLTLVKAYSDNKIECVFPLLFKGLTEILQKSETTYGDIHVHLRKSIPDEIFSDEKEFLMKMFCHTSKTFAENKSIKRLLHLDTGVSNEILNEILTTSLANTVTVERTFPEKVGKGKTNEFIDTQEYPDADRMISVQELARREGVSVSSMYTYLSNGRVIGAIRKSETGNYIIPNNAELAPLPLSKKQMSEGQFLEKQPRKQAQTKKRRTVYKTSGDIESPLGDAPYVEVQEKIAQDNLMSQNAGRYVRTMAEYKYYINNRYHEVLWNGRPAFIIDINPDYLCKKSGKTNRELINDEKSPVVPGNENYKYIVHHLGQEPDSPFVIIPQNDHVKLTAIFHQGSSPNKDLHGTEFKEQKKLFWKTYIEKYDTYGTFSSIPSRSLNRTIKHYISTINKD